jgi:hypothetical protein
MSHPARSSYNLPAVALHGSIALAVLEIIGRDPECTMALFPPDHPLSRKLDFSSYYRSGIAIGENLRRPSLDYPSTCNSSGSGVRMDSAPPDRSPVTVECSPVCFAILGEAEPCGGRASQKSGCLWNTFVMIGSRDAFLGLLGRTVPHLIAAIVEWFSAPDLDRIYREIELIDFSKDVLSAAPERLLVLRDGPSWVPAVHRSCAPCLRTPPRYMALQPVAATRERVLSTGRGLHQRYRLISHQRSIFFASTNRRHRFPGYR